MWLVLTKKDSSEIDKEKKGHNYRGKKKLYFLNFCLLSFDPQTEANKSIHWISYTNYFISIPWTKTNEWEMLLVYISQQP